MASGFQTGAVQADAFQSDADTSTFPQAAVWIDWEKSGAFDLPIDDVTPHLVGQGITYERGRSSDMSGEAKGAASFVLSNIDHRWTPDRNWHDNPSFEAGDRKSVV